MYEEENWDDEIAGLSPKSAPQSLPTWTPSSSSFGRGQSQSQRSNTVWFFIIFLQNKHMLIMIDYDGHSKLSHVCLNFMLYVLLSNDNEE